MNYLPGTNDFLIGCNYWSSEAGVSMWHEWSIEAVEKDFAALKEAGMNTVRLFPSGLGEAGERAAEVIDSRKNSPRRLRYRGSLARVRGVAGGMRGCWTAGQDGAFRKIRSIL